MKANNASASSSPLVPGQTIQGFLVQSVAPLVNLRASAIQLEHQKTGARILHIHNEDAENLFSVTFPTPVNNSTGVPHILEHSVLAGSKKFPVKDPFFEMVKSSMATFINAMTDSDHTMYPVSSNVRQDFFNLAEVYWDAVFYPLLTENTFRREGHHLEFSTPGDTKSELAIKGIVYNEMKGYYSEADGYASGQSWHWLFPDTNYGHDSGGDPEHIPELTYAAFKKFHQDYYHPSNAYIFLYGDIPTADHLAFLSDRLSAFSRQSPRVELKRQPRWPAPKSRMARYPIGKEEQAGEKTFIVLGWIAGDATDATDVLTMAVLDFILTGNQGAPLRKAIIDSKLGQDFFATGYSSNGLEAAYRAGIKGSEADRAPAFEKLVLETLRQIADTGITKKRVDAAFQQVAYHFLEIQSLFPLHQLSRALGTWLYGRNPLAFLRADEILKQIEKQYAADPQLFSRIIHERLLNNKHRLTTVFSPEPGMQEKKDAAFTEKMRQFKAGLTQPQLTKIADEFAELERLQNEPNTPEALAMLPQLQVKDLPAKPRHIPTTMERVQGVEILRNDIFSNGVNYLHLDINLEGLPAELYAYLPIYADIFRKMGAGKLDYVQMAQRVAAHTGGVSFWATTSNHFSDPQRFLRRARVSLKFLDRKAGDALGVLHDLLFAVNPRDLQRLASIMQQSKAWHRSQIVDNGVGTARLHAGRGFNMEGALAETMHGLPQFRLVEKIADGFTAQGEGLIAKLEAIRNFMLNRRRLTASFTGTPAVYDTAASTLGQWASEMGDKPVVDEPLSFAAWQNAPREGLAAPMQVAYCAAVFSAPHVSHPDSALLSLGSAFLSRGYLLEEIRFKGTAYGAGGSYNWGNRTWNFFSYMDPHVNRTLKVFQDILQHAHNDAWSKTDIDHTIISTAKEGERPIRPAEATEAALSRHILGITRDLREEHFARTVNASPAEVKRATIQALEENLKKAAVCVVSSREKLEQANVELPEKALVIEDIMG